MAKARTAKVRAKVKAATVRVVPWVRAKVVARAKVNREKSIGLQLGTWRDKTMQSNSVVRRWMNGRLSR